MAMPDHAAASQGTPRRPERRRFHRRAAALTGLGLLGSAAGLVQAVNPGNAASAPNGNGNGAEAWPARPIRLIVPYPPGGAADATGRIYAEALSEALKQSVIAENKPGAGTAIAAEYVAAAPPDGYVLSLVPTGQLTVLPHIQKSLKFDPFKSFQPVSMLAATGVVIAANPAVPANDLKSLIALSRARPDTLTYSSSGSGTIIHLAGEYFKLATGADLRHVPFKGSAPAITAVIGGHVDVSVDTLTVLAPQIRSGKLKGLAIASRERSPQLPDLPTASELGFPDFEVVSWFGLAAPAGTPPAIVSKLGEVVAQAASQAGLRERLALQGLEPWPLAADAFAARIRRDYDTWGRVVRESAITFD